MENRYADKTLIKMKDDTLHEISSEQWCASEGCETCGYGSSYITEIDLFFDDCYVHISQDESYGYGELNGTFFLRFFIGNLEEIKKMTFYEFMTFLKKKIKEDLYDDINIEGKPYF